MMELNEIPEAFQSKLRLMIISALIPGEKSFLDLREITNATDGNISVQISNLEKVGYVTVKKEFIGKRTHTSVGLTEQGREAFLDYIRLLNEIIGS